MTDEQPNDREENFRKKVRKPTTLGKPKVLGETCLEKRNPES